MTHLSGIPGMFGMFGTDCSVGSRGQRGSGLRKTGCVRPTRFWPPQPAAYHNLPAATCRPQPAGLRNLLGSVQPAGRRNLLGSVQPAGLRATCRPQPAGLGATCWAGCNLPAGATCWAPCNLPAAAICWAGCRNLLGFRSGSGQAPVGPRPLGSGPAVP